MGIQLLKILISIIIIGISIALIESEIIFLIIIGMILDIIVLLMLCVDRKDSVIKSIFKK
jgi:hypothetical protein